MSTSKEADFDLELHFLPAWAQEAPDPNRYAKYTGDSSREDRRGDRPPRRRDDHGPRPPRREHGGPGRPARRDGPRPDRGGPRPAPRGGERGGERGRPERAPAPPPLPEINVAFRPDDKGVESLARQIKMTGRAYPLFDIAQMILRKPERHTVVFSVRKKADGQVVQPLYVCALDESVWLAEEDAVRYVLDKYFSTFYQPEKTQIEAPKGTYTFVAQCGMSGVILGPPNYHDYQNQLRKLHTERFSRMPFDAFKARVRIVRDEAVVKKWLEEQSWKTDYVCLNLPEPVKLSSREEVEKHFRETHLPNIIKAVETATVSGTVSRNLQAPALMRLVRHTWEEQKRFPLQIATVLSQQFATHGLQFFKVNKTVTHVSVARPHYLDLEAAPVSDGIRRIVNFINATPKCTRRLLVEGLLPGQAPEPKPPGAAPAPGAEEVPAPEPSPEVTALNSDLHWLIHQGHVIEFANGILETAKKPLPKPEKPPRPAPAKPEEKPAAAGTELEKSVAEGAPAEDVVASAPAAAEPAQESTAGPEARSDEADLAASATENKESQASDATPQPHV